jgi:hypothetical protein
MITQEEAIAIAKSAVCKEKGWTYFPDDAVLTSAYFSERGRWVFEWKRETDLFYSEVERILVWISDLGEVLKEDAVWYKEAPPAEISTNVAALIKAVGYKTEEAPASVIKEAVGKRIKEVSNMDVKVLNYRRIKKEVWHFFVPKTEISDFYWVGESTTGELFLFDSDGHAVGHMVIPRSISSTGHYYGPGYYPERDRCPCWLYLANSVKPYFEKWCPETTVGCAPAVVPADGGTKECKNSYISLDDMDNCVKDYKTKFDFTVAHGDYSLFYYVPYTSDTAYASCSSITGVRTSVEELMMDRGPERLHFAIHCDAMDKTGAWTIEYYYRKGETTNTIVIGLKHTTNTSWETFYNWLPAFLSDIDTNRTKKIKDAYDDAADTYPDIKGHIDFTGDPDLTIERIIRSDLCKIT